MSVMPATYSLGGLATELARDSRTLAKLALPIAANPIGQLACIGEGEIVGQCVNFSFGHASPSTALCAERAGCRRSYNLG
jgi:hypothetical protein